MNDGLSGTPTSPAYGRSSSGFSISMRRRTPRALVDNADWLTKLSAMGSSCATSASTSTVNAMPSHKESVKRRIESEDGISYTEFSYSLLQAYDLSDLLHDRLRLHAAARGQRSVGQHRRRHRSHRRVRAAKAHGLVMPLLTTASGAKFGKTEGRCGVARRDAERPPYEFYQFWFNTDDRDAVRYLKFFTFLDRPAVEALEAASAKATGESAMRSASSRARSRDSCTVRRPSWRWRPRPKSCFAAICQRCR